MKVVKVFSMKDLKKLPVREVTGGPKLWRP